MYIYISKNSQNNHVCSNDSDDFLGMCDPPDVEPEDISEANSQNYFETGVLKDKENIKICPTTNAADENFEARAESEYYGQNNEFTIPGSCLICVTTSLFFRKRHEFHESKSEKYFFQRFRASTKGTSFPLLYTEGAIFPSMFWSTANDNYYISGSIPSPLLSGSCKEDGFYYIPTHVCSRLTNFSSSTSSDYCYAVFGHDLICSIAANNCNMRQHRKGITSSNTVASGLDLNCKDDSNFLHSIDSR